MFQFSRFAYSTYFERLSSYSPKVGAAWLRIIGAGLPHSDTPGSKLAYSSPRFFAVNHVLLRQLVPRHPPCALMPLILFLFSITTRLFKLSSKDLKKFIKKKRWVRRIYLFWNTILLWHFIYKTSHYCAASCFEIHITMNFLVHLEITLLWLVSP